MAVDDPLAGVRMPPLQGVEIKVSVRRAAMDRAIKAFGLVEREGETRTIYFCEAGPALPLLRAGVILRLRKKGKRGGDSTVKFRPLKRPLAAGWSAEVARKKIRLEADWAGKHTNIAACADADQDQGEIDGTARGERPLSKLFSDLQERFLNDHRSIPAALDELHVLGPIDAMKWGPTDMGFSEPMVAERWVVGDLAFLELSIKVDDDDLAAATQERFQRFIEQAGFSENDLEDELKTKRVLEKLSRQ